MRRAAKADGNQPALVELMRASGAKVLHLHRVGQGVFDLLIGYRGRLALCEVKRPGEWLNDKQKGFHAEWGLHYPVFVVRDDADVRQMLSDLRQ